MVEQGIVELPEDRPDAGSFEETVVADYFGHPMHYDYVAARFPDLKLCLSHGGGPEEWDAHPASTVHWAMRNWSSLVISMVRKHGALYTDTASVLGLRARDRLKELLQDPEVRARILYGSDYHTVSLEGSERDFLVDTVRALGKDDFRRIAFANPRKFLSSTLHPMNVSRL
jgi:predicted TIM-barrel fold metal-dependent hydrolase